MGLSHKLQAIRGSSRPTPVDSQGISETNVRIWSYGYKVLDGQLGRAGSCGPMIALIRLDMDPGLFESCWGLWWDSATMCQWRRDHVIATSNATCDIPDFAEKRNCLKF